MIGGALVSTVDFILRSASQYTLKVNHEPAFATKILKIIRLNFLYSNDCESETNEFIMIELSEKMENEYVNKCGNIFSFTSHLSFPNDMKLYDDMTLNSRLIP